MITAQQLFSEHCLWIRPFRTQTAKLGCTESHVHWNFIEAGEPADGGTSQE